MLLLLMRAHSQPAPVPGALRPDRKVRDYTAELLGAALFMSAWCVIRLLFRRDTSHGVDAVIAVLGLMVGAGAVAHCLRRLRDGRLRLHAEPVRARAAKRQERPARPRSRVRRHR